MANEPCGPGTYAEMFELIMRWPKLEFHARRFTFSGGSIYLVVALDGDKTRALITVEEKKSDAWSLASNLNRFALEKRAVHGDD